MKWLKSTSPKRWTLGAGTRQFIIPAVSDSNYLQMEDTDFAAVSSQAVVASLIKNKGILVLDEEPAELKNTIPALQEANADLVTELANAKAEIEQLKATQVAAVAAVQDKLDAKQKELDAKQKELEDLDVKASALIEEKDATIAKLEKKLKKQGE